MAPLFPTKWAILVGPKDYQYVVPLQYSTDDIVSVGKAFRKYLEFKDKNILEFGAGLKLAPLAHVFYHEVYGLLESGGIQEDDLLVFYFSGHGIRDKKDYLLPVEATPHNLKRTGIEFEDLVDHLTNSKCKNVVLFVDACREAIPGERGVISIGEESRQILERAGFAAIFSCDPNELSYEIDELRHGSFTHCFLEALEGGTCITVAEVYDYLLKAVPLTNQRFNKRVQRPYPVQAGDKWGLQIFSSSVQLLRSTRRFDELIKQITDFFQGGAIDYKHMAGAVEFLDGARDKELGEDDKAKLDLIERFCGGRVKPSAFVVIWDAIEKRGGLVVGATKATPDLGPLP